jgi:hypothetical protein
MTSLNRERFEENRRAVALQMVMRAAPVFICFILLVLIMCAGGVAFYVWGWVIWAEYGNTPNDVALKAWLLVLLCLPIATLVINLIVGVLARNHGSDRPDAGEVQAEQRTRDLKKRAMTLVDLVWLGTIIAGACMYFSCDTCARRSPALYHYLQLYLIFIGVVWVLQFAVLFGFVGFVFWMRHNGLLENDQAMSLVGRPGLIKEIETVPFDYDAFGKEAAQCCVCQEDLRPGRLEAVGAGKEIKRTPCGHFFHEGCLGNWLGNFAKTCPLCRTDLEEALDELRGQPGGAAPPAMRSGGDSERPTLLPNSELHLLQDGSSSVASSKLTSMFPVPR